MPASKFRQHPQPDPEVVDLLERVLDSARKGYVKTVAIIPVNQLHQVEIGLAGDLSHVRTNAILAGLARIAHQMMNREPPTNGD